MICKWIHSYLFYYTVIHYEMMCYYFCGSVRKYDTPTQVNIIINTFMLASLVSMAVTSCSYLQSSCFLQLVISLVGYNPGILHSFLFKHKYFSILCFLLSILIQTWKWLKSNSIPIHAVSEPTLNRKMKRNIKRWDNIKAPSWMNHAKWS